MVQSLPGFLNLCLDVCSPSQVLWNVYTEVLEAAHPVHRGPTDHKRSVGPQVSLSEVHNQLFSFAHIQRETVVLAPWCKSLYLIQVCGLIIVGNEAQNHSIISKFDNRCGAVRGHAVMCVKRVEQGAQDTTLWGSYVQGDGVWGELAYFHHLRSAEVNLLHFPAALQFSFNSDSCCDVSICHWSHGITWFKFAVQSSPSLNLECSEMRKLFARACVCGLTHTHVWIEVNGAKSAVCDHGLSLKKSA